MALNIVSPVYGELVDYLAQTATPEQILGFKVSEAMQKRADELLERNSEGDLTPEEALELQQMLQFDRMVSLLKARAARSLQES
jgi:hypothetical protein